VDSQLSNIFWRKVFFFFSTLTKQQALPKTKGVKLERQESNEQKELPKGASASKAALKKG